MTTTKFYSGLDAKEPVVLVHGVSLDNPKQSDDYRQEFVKLIQNHHKRIAHCIELLGDKIYALYAGEKQTQILAQQWQDKNHQKQFSILWSWQQLSNHDDYSSVLKLIEDDYQNDLAFKAIVDEFSKKHTHKKNKFAAYQYVIQECAGFLVLPTVIRQTLSIKQSTPIIVTYPAKEFNAAISYQLKKHHSELQYRGYHLHLPEKEILIKQCLKLEDELKKHNIINKDDQQQFVNEVFNLIHHYQTKESDYHDISSFQKGFFNQ